MEEDLSKQLLAILEAGISDDVMKTINKQVEQIRFDIKDDVMVRLKDELAPSLVAWVADMAKRTVEQILDGNEEQMRRYLSCEKRGPDGEYYSWTGRSTEDFSFGGRRAPEDWHPIIHGDLFEQGSIRLRRDLVNAHPDLLKNERILDLEDQVKSLVAQVNKAKAEKEAMLEHHRNCTHEY